MLFNVYHTVVIDEWQIKNWIKLNWNWIDMLEKSTSDWIRRGKPARKNIYYHYSAFLSSRLDLLQAWFHSRSFNFPPTSPCSLTAVFSFFVGRLFASSNWSTDIAMVLINSYLKELHQERFLVADQLGNWVASSSHLYNPAKVVSVDSITSYKIFKTVRAFSLVDRRV